MITAQERTTTILSIDTSNREDSKFLLSETELYTQEELTCVPEGKTFKTSWSGNVTWQCELNKNGLIERMEIVSDEGHRLMNHAYNNKLTMTVNYSNERQKEFCKYVTTLK
jgi:hypothetical protein